jgi:hypothetical protein
MDPEGKPSTLEGSHIMARKSLSSQVIEEIDRTRGLLAPIIDISDPMTGHIIGSALESLNKVERLCVEAGRSAPTISDFAIPLTQHQHAPTATAPEKPAQPARKRASRAATK